MGTGLGLAVVHGIVKERGGGIAVESKNRQGREIHGLSARLLGRVGTGGFTGGCEWPHPGMGRILLVDDETAILRLGRKILEHLGYEVETFDSGTDALAAFRDDPDRFDLIITDMTIAPHHRRSPGRGNHSRSPGHARDPVHRLQQADLSKEGGENRHSGPPHEAPHRVGPGRDGSAGPERFLSPAPIHP